MDEEAIAEPSDALALVRAVLRRERLVLALAVTAAPLAGILAGVLSRSGQTLSLSLLLLLLAPVVAWWRFPVAVLGLFFVGVVIEQFHIGAPGGNDLTDLIPLYTSLNSGVGISGVFFNPMELAMAGMLAVILARMGLHQAALPRSALAGAILLLLSIIAFGLIQGLASHGNYKQVFDEVRPVAYLAMMYVLASQLPGKSSTLVAMLWTFIAIVAVKSVQGTVLVFTTVLGHPHRPQYLLGHEDSLFLAVFIALVAALWLFQRRGRMRTVATLILPLAALVEVANNRRAGWLMLGGAMLALMLLGFVRLPQRRRLVVTLMTILVVGFLIYLPLFWNHDGGLLGEPARAIRSEVAPDARDLASNLYRHGENIDLGIDIKSKPIFGSGFGTVIPHPIPIVNLAPIDPSINFVPHDTILYIWYRLGPLGELSFWLMIGFAIVTACRLLRSPDLDVAIFAVFAVFAVIAYVGEGYVDLGLAFFRVAVFVGCVLGGLEVAAKVQAQIEADSTECRSSAAPGVHRRNRRGARGAESYGLNRRRRFGADMPGPLGPATPANHRQRSGQR